MKGGRKMEKIKIITDSTADLPKSIIDRYDIEVMPLTVNFGQESYMDGIDINTHEMLNKMDETGVFPGTAQVTPIRFQEVFSKFLNEGYKIVSLHLSWNMSGTYQSACIAKSYLDTQDIVVIDSRNVTSGLGLLVMKAARLKEEGLGIHEIEEEISKVIPHVKSSLGFESLDNLVKGGRLPRIVGTIGNMLGIRLILAVENGEMVVKDKVRGSKKAVRTMLNCYDSLGVKEGEPTILLNAEGEEMRAALKNGLESRNADFIECEVGCVVGVHAGRGASGLFFIEKY